MKKFFASCLVFLASCGHGLRGDLSTSRVDQLHQELTGERETRQRLERENARLQRDFDIVLRETPAQTQTRLATERQASAPTTAATPQGSETIAAQPPQQQAAAHSPPSSVAQTNVPPCDVDGMGLPVPGGINETQGSFDGPAPHAGASPAGDYTVTLINFPYATSFSVNGRIQHQFSGGTFPSETVIRTATGGLCRMPMVPPGERRVSMLFDHVGRQHVQVTCYRYVSGRPAEAFGGFILRPNVPYSTGYPVLGDSCMPLPGM